MIQKLDRRVKSLEGPSVSLKRGISETADSVNNRVGEDVRRAQKPKNACVWTLRSQQMRQVIQGPVSLTSVHVATRRVWLDVLEGRWTRF